MPSLPAENLSGIILFLLLLSLSATFSGCETSLFSLTVPELNRIRAGRSRLDRAIAELHANLKTLLPILLFCNMAVNTLMYSLSSSIAARLGEERGAGAALLFGSASLFLVLFLGEAFPKQFAISSSLTVCRLVALPVWCCRRLLVRPLSILNSLVTVCERLISPGGAGRSLELREEELRLLMEISRRDGVISDGEYELIDGVVELPEVRIRDLMIPRVDVPPLVSGADPERALALARETGHCKIPILDSAGTDFSGWIDARDLLAPRPEGAAGRARPPDGLAGHLRGFRFFSEHDRADQALARIRNRGNELFAVVDERGQAVGFFTLRDLMDEITGAPGGEGLPLIQETGDGFILSGRLSVKEWREFFDISEALPRSVTLGGLIVSLLGRMARPGDQARLRNIRLTVLEVERNRVSRVEARLEPPETEGRTCPPSSG